MKNPENEKQIPYCTFDMNVQYILSKKGVKVTTDDYVPAVDECAYEDTTSTDWKEAFENEHYTIKELLHELEQYIEKELSVIIVSSGRGRELLRMLSDAQGWEVEKETFEEG